MIKLDQDSIVIQAPLDVKLLIAKELPQHDVFKFFAVDKTSNQQFEKTPLYQSYLKRAFQNYLSLRGAEQAPNEDEVFKKFYENKEKKTIIDSLLLEHVEMGTFLEHKWYNFFDLAIENETLSDFIHLQTVSSENFKNNIHSINTVLYMKFNFKRGILYSFNEPNEPNEPNEQIIQSLLEKTNTNESVRICFNITMDSRNNLHAKYRKEFLLYLMQYIKENNKKQIKIIDLTDKFINIIERVEPHLHLGHTLKISDLSQLLDEPSLDIKIYAPDPMSLLPSLQNPNLKNKLIAHPFCAQYPNPLSLKEPFEISIDNIEFACTNNLTHFYINAIHICGFLHVQEFFERDKKIINFISKNISPYYYTTYDSPSDVNLSYITALTIQLIPLLHRKESMLDNNDFHWFRVIQFIFDTIKKSGIDVKTYEFKYMAKAITESYTLWPKGKLRTMEDLLQTSHKYYKIQNEKMGDVNSKKSYFIAKLSLLFYYDFLKVESYENEKFSLATSIASLADSTNGNYNYFLDLLSNKLGKRKQEFRDMYVLFPNIIMQ